MKTVIKYQHPVCVTEGKCYIIGERYCDGRFVGYVHHYGKLDAQLTCV